MASQTDLDKGGTVRHYVRQWLGPSVGWLFFPAVGILPVTAAGTTTVVIGTTLVTVNVNGSVTVQLPSAKQSVNASAGALPGLAIGNPITIVDIGGFAQAQPITILPFGAETIMGLASIQVGTDYGAWTLIPNLTLGGWTNQQ